MAELSVSVRLLVEDARVPAYARPGDAGADLRITQTVRLGPGERALVGTGVAVAIPPGHAGFVHPRSGLAHTHGISIVNAPGVIDSGYRGEIMLNLINLDAETAVTLKAGERAAQLVVQKVESVSFETVGELERTERQANGHGSTGR